MGQSLSAHFSVSGLELSLPLFFIIILFYVIPLKPLCKPGFTPMAPALVQFSCVTDRV